MYECFFYLFCVYIFSFLNHEVNLRVWVYLVAKPRLILKKMFIWMFDCKQEMCCLVVCVGGGPLMLLLAASIPLSSSLMCVYLQEGGGS